MKVEIVEMFPGGGTLLDALTRGLKRGGAEVSVAGLIELEARYLAISAKAHPEASTWTGSVGEWHPAELSAPRQAFRIFIAGIPCTGASPAGLSKNGLSCAEEHPDVGYLFLPTIHYIRLHKPDIVVLENTSAYRNTLSAKLLRDALCVSGFTNDERVVNPWKEFGAPCQRKRWISVASRTGFSWIYEAKPFTGTLADYLDPECSEDDKESATPEQVAADEKYIERKKAEGCGFFRGRTILDRSSTRCGTIPKSYGRRQSNGTFVKTATSYRLLRPREIARIHQFDQELFAGLPKTTQYELYGQGVDASAFLCLGECIARHLAGERPIRQTGQLELFAG